MIKLVKNKENKKIYRILQENIINKTNLNKGQNMIMYSPIDKIKNKVLNKFFIKEKEEFYKEFEKI